MNYIQVCRKELQQVLSSDYKTYQHVFRKESIHGPALIADELFFFPRI